MCTYVTETVPATGSAKSARGWFPLTAITAYYDHPVHAQAEHTLNLDFANADRGASARAAVELTTGSAVALLRAVSAVLAQVPEDLSGLDPVAAARLRDAVDELVGEVRETGDPSALSGSSGGPRSSSDSPALRAAGG